MFQIHCEQAKRALQNVEEGHSPFIKYFTQLNQPERPIERKLARTTF